MLMRPPDTACGPDGIPHRAYLGLLRASVGILFDVLEALAAADEVIALAIFGQSLVEVVLPEFPVAGCVVDVKVDPVHGHISPQRLGQPTATGGRVEHVVERPAV